MKAEKKAEMKAELKAGWKVDCLVRMWVDLRVECSASNLVAQRVYLKVDTKEIPVRYIQFK
jgi:hypothetical protein